VSIRCLADNALILLEPKPTETASGIQLVHMKGPGAREHRTAKVIAVGPGHHPGCKSCGGSRSTFIPTTLKPGDRIVVDALCGNKWNMDVSSVRQNERTDFDSMLGERGDYRVIREAEALCLVEDESQAAE
jgi:co-chaperonin GroES (HSP10)